jgi:hypothetical protein
MSLGPTSGSGAGITRRMLGKCEAAMQEIAESETNAMECIGWAEDVDAPLIARLTAEGLLR